MDVRLPDGTIIQGVPDNISKAELTAKLARNGYDVSQLNGAQPNNEVDPNIARVDVVGHRDPATAGVPGADPTAVAGNRNVGAAPTDRSITDSIIGGGETALALATGAIGAGAGAVAGAAKSLFGGNFGTQQGVREGEELAGRVAEAATYQPRTQAGQDFTQAVGQVAADSGVAGLALPELNAAANAAGNASRAVRGAAAASAATQGAEDAALVASKGPSLRDLVRTPAGAPEAPVVSQIRKVSPAIADRVQRTLTRNPDAAPAAGTRGSVGAAGADVAQQRVQAAESLPVPIQLTEGQATRDHPQTMFERETAKLPDGEKLRQRYADQNEQIPQNIDAWIDQTGAQAYGARAVGESVVKAIEQKAARDKIQVNVAYSKAKRSPEALVAVDPAEQFLFKVDDDVAPTSLVDYINSKPSGLQTTGIVDDARKFAIKLGVVAPDGDGGVVGLRTNVKTMEELRKQINQLATREPVDKREAAILKGLIDGHTEPVSGPNYRQARRLRENFGKQYEDREMIDRLLDTKGRYTDRKIALDDVFQNTILKGSLDDRRHLRRVLLAHDKSTPPELRAAGEQAWRDLQGALLRHLKDDSLKGVGSDIRGNPIFSPAKLNDNILKLDEDGTLQFVLGRKGAENIRDINDLSKLVFTAPPGSFNSSGTTATLLAALGEAGVNGSLLGLPVPVLTTLRFLAKQHKRYQLAKRIEIALTRRVVESKTNPPPAPAARPTLH